MSDTFDVNRATAIIEHAIAANMFETMPQGDADKIVAAEQLVELARQVETVRNAWIAQGGEEIAKERVPHWPVAEKILLEAHVFVGSDRSANGSTTDTDQQPQGGSDVTAPQDSSASTDAASVDQPEPQSQEASVEVSDSEGDVALAGEILKTADGTMFSGDPVKDEVWSDAFGTEWLVLSYTGGASVEVQKVSTGECTVAPVGMLKRKVSSFPDSSPTVVVEQEETTTENDIKTGEPDHEQEPEVVITPDPGKPDEPLVPSPSDERTALQKIGDAAAKMAKLLPPPIDLPVLDPPVPEHNDEGDDRYQTLLAETEADYTPSGMPVPHDLDDPPDIKPENFDEVPDRVARALHSKFNALAARAKFLHDVEDARARECKMVLQLFMRGARRLARGELGNSATVTELEGWAEDNDENVSTWKERASKHSGKASAYKTFFDIYTQHVVVLSRDWSMRDRQMNS